MFLGLILKDFLADFDTISNPIHTIMVLNELIVSICVNFSDEIYYLTCGNWKKTTTKKLHILARINILEVGSLGCVVCVVDSTGPRPKAYPWSSYQIWKIAVCACAGNAGNVYPPLQVGDPDMHHGTCVMWSFKWPTTQIARFMWPTWGTPGSCRTQMAPCWPHEPCYQGRSREISQHFESICWLNTHHRK